MSEQTELRAGPGAPGTLVTPALLPQGGPDSQAAAPLPAHPFGFLASPLSSSTPPSSPNGDAGLTLRPRLMAAGERLGKRRRHSSQQQRLGGGAGRSARVTPLVGAAAELQSRTPSLPPSLGLLHGRGPPGLQEAYTELGAGGEAPSPLCAADKLGARRPGIFLCPEAAYLR